MKLMWVFPLNLKHRIRFLYMEMLLEPLIAMGMKLLMVAVYASDGNGFKSMLVYQKR